MCVSTVVNAIFSIFLLFMNFKEGMILGLETANITFKIGTLKDLHILVTLSDL